MNDLTLRRRILDELELLPHIDAAAIGVTLENGVVALTGHVRTYAENIAAYHAVQSVKGVEAVAAELEVPLSRSHAIDKRKAVEHTAWAVPGVYRVENHLLID